MSIAFVTLLERHGLGVAQNRVGPNKVGWFGVVQPILDGIKLLSKEGVVSFKSYKIIYCLAPAIVLVIMFIEFCLIPKLYLLNTMAHSLLFLLCLVGLMVYGQLLGGFASTSKYGYLGALRASAQRVSYEVVFTLLLLVVCNFNSSFELGSQNNVMWCCSGFILWLIVVLAETRRTPFDFRERERELVSGFNVEYARVGFVLYFLREYGSLLFFSMLTSCLFLNGSLWVAVSIVVMVIILRATLPRFRFDLLLRSMWVKLLPVVVVLLLLLLT